MTSIGCSFVVFLFLTLLYSFLCFPVFFSFIFESKPFMLIQFVHLFIYLFTVCPSMDIRNLVNNLSQLEGCRVVEGFLHIVLMEQTDLTGFEFNNYTFPKLREITGYLLLYRVFGLRSIGQLFPNLAVVRGQMLFFDFALVIYELTQLQVINPTHLYLLYAWSYVRSGQVLYFIIFFS